MHDTAQLRKGQLVHDHPPPYMITAKSVAMKMSLNMSLPSKNTFITQLPSPYYPSDHSVDELQPICIRQMRLEQHHRGAKVIIRVLTPPSRINAVTVAVEDLEGTAVTLQLYHHPPQVVVSPDEIIQMGRVLLLKEPFFKCATDGSYSLRVDHLSDVIWLEPSDARIPDVWKKSVPEMSSEEARMQGNDAVKRQRWAEAMDLYSDAIRYAVSPREAQLAFVNRSLVNLKLGRFEQALLDATCTKEDVLPTEKALFREIRALYELQSFERCRERLQQFIETYPDNSDAHREMKRVEVRLQESHDGLYSFAGHMYKEARRKSAVTDSASFSKNVEVRGAPGRGRGLFTVQAVRAGDLLLCEKAFIYKYCDMDSGHCSILMDLHEKRAFAGGQAEILTQAIQNLYHNPEMSRPFLQLHHGNYRPVAQERADGNPIVDSFLAAKIISLNVFGAPRTSRKKLSHVLKNGKDEGDEKSVFGTAGIWIKASYVNHSCVGNCRRSFIGDMLILRATADMESGTELVFPYRHPTELESYDDVQRGLRHWGFVCDCALCRARRATPAAQLNKRQQLMEALKNIIHKPETNALARGVKLLNDLKRTYPAQYSPEQPRLELRSACFSMAMEYFHRGDLRKTVEMLLQGLGALGYKLTSVWPSADRAAARPPAAQFEIERWGVADDMVPWALVNLHGISKSIAPSLSQRILEYAYTAYSMVVGEDETFLQTFPTGE
ncbi:hypothetical protein PWT90_09254 [Aphanocladium album]|nr:hypothetical protein PWT90_09254 [Aphanocladium album]